jgi:SpoVK/Ycf46/Vps4 family AAA+-type ATPase
MSAILFGPPGTSKTTLAGLIAEFLHWPLLQIDPSYLVQQGWDRIQAQASRLFSMLTATERVVVLLDEFDEIGRDRSGNQEILSRFITTAVLPKLAKINQERRIVFLLATNYIRSFDAAFSRGGWFDMLIPVFPPTVDAKRNEWPLFRTLEQRLAAGQAARARMLLAHLTYDECKQLASKLTSDDSADAYFHKLSEAYEAGTLKRPLIAESAERTWENACIDDQRQIRLPPIKPENTQRPSRN